MMKDTLLFPYGEMDRALRDACSGEELFDFYRLVDPQSHEVYRCAQGELERQDLLCYEVWKRGAPCANCISRHCCTRRQHFFKLEYLEGSIFLILALPVELLGKTFSMELVKDVTTCMSVSGDNRHESTQVLDIINRYNHLMVHDSFTGLYNKLYISDQLDAMVKGGEAGAVGAIFDLDDFKLVNDTHGHYTGDQVLRGVSGVLERWCNGQSTWAGRLGGDEFCLIFPEKDLEKARSVCKEVRREIEEIRFRKDQTSFRVKVSVGIAQLREGDTQETFLDRMDRELYKNKVENKARRGFIPETAANKKGDLQMKLEDFYENRGDYQTVLERFSGNQGLLERFLKKLPGDPTFQKLNEAVAANDRQGMEMYAHTLKGVAANLGLEELRARSARMVDALRAGELDSAPGLFQSIRGEYESLCEKLGQLD